MNAYEPPVWQMSVDEVKALIETNRQQADRIAELEAENAKMKTKLIGKALVKALDGFTEKSKPVAWITENGTIFDELPPISGGLIPLYTHPVKQLSDEEIEELAMQYLENTGAGIVGVYDFVRAIIKEITE